MTITKFFFAITAVLIVFSFAPGQKIIDEVQLGARKVRIPAPDGFSEVSTRFDRIFARMIATEAPQNEVLSMHLPMDHLESYAKNQDQDLSFYTKVSIAKRARNEDITPAIFEYVKRDVEKGFARMLDPNSPQMKTLANSSSKNLTELYGNLTKLKFTHPLNLGVFDNTDRVYSHMALMNLSVNDRGLTVLGTSSFVMVNKRLVFLYVYKLDPIEADTDALRNFTKNWTRAVVAANKELTTKRR